MADTNYKILLVEDDADDYVLFKEYFNEIKSHPYVLSWVDTYEKALQEILRKDYDVYIFDYLLGAKTGLDLIRDCRAIGIDAPIILLTGLGSPEIDLKAMELGASDYLVKGEIDAEKLERSIRYSSEQARMLKKLKASENKFRSIFENSYDVIYIFNEEGHIIDINKSAERLFGYSYEELSKMNIDNLYEDKLDLTRFMEAVNKTGSYSNFETILIDKLGNRKFCTLTANIQKIDEKGNIYYQGIIHDMTRRKKAEQELMIVEKLAVTGRVARTLAHEVRNPLTNINLAVEQLDDDIRDEDCKRYFEIIKRNSNRINDLITQLMENSRPTELSSGRVSLNSLLITTINLAKDRAALKNVRIEADLKAEADIQADENKLMMALLNIIINAIEAVDADTGVIKISSDCVERKCIITIEDNGTGIDTDDTNRIFEPYFTGKPNGVGLGLATTHNIIRTHKGNIEVESEKGKGTRFTIVLDCS
jgi:PAS domain S-box-containing protein